MLLLFIIAGSGYGLVGSVGSVDIDIPAEAAKSSVQPVAEFSITSALATADGKACTPHNCEPVSIENCTPAQLEACGQQHQCATSASSVTAIKAAQVETCTPQNCTPTSIENCTPAQIEACKQQRQCKPQSCTVPTSTTTSTKGVL